MILIRASGLAEPLTWRLGLTQIRVHELASELNVSTHQVVSYLEDLGMKVRGPSTVIGVSAAAKVRGRFRSAKPSDVGSGAAQPSVVAPAPDVGRDAPARHTAADAAGQTGNGAMVRVDDTASRHDGAADKHGPTYTTGSAGSARTALAPALFLPPVAAAAASSLPRSVGSFSSPFAVPTAVQSVPNRSASRPAPLAAAPKALPRRVAPVPPAQQLAQPEPDFDALWESRGFAKADQQRWLEAGLRPAEAQLADRCQSAGIAPDELSRKLSGRTALQRLRDGEASTSVWARIREAEQQPRRAGTKLTGRFQLS